MKLDVEWATAIAVALLLQMPLVIIVCSLPAKLDGL
jgi:hypothetical protein